MSSSRDRASARRAFGAASVFERWIKDLSDQLKKNNIQLNPQGSYEGAILIPVKMVADMIETMGVQVKEIRERKPPR
jgi:hypothetical protein